MNVFVVLTLGILVSGGIGFATGQFTLLKYAQEIYSGFTGMNEIFLLSLLTGGLAVMVREAGGIEWLIEKVQSIIVGKKSALFGIGLLVALVDMAVANNTVAIIINGPIAKKLSNTYKVDPRKTATVLDTFSCIAQGAIPYGAQMLILLGFTQGAVSFLDVFPLLWYQGLLLVLSILSFFIPFADYYINKNPWDWSKEEIELD